MTEQKQMKASEWCKKYSETMGGKPYLEIGERHDVEVIPAGAPMLEHYSIRINDNTFYVSEAKALANWILEVCD